MKQLFITGQSPLLSLTELNSLIKPESLIEWNESGLITELDLDRNRLSKLHNRLGGTIKICEVINVIEKETEPAALNDQLTQNLFKTLASELDKQIGKRLFGLSIYPISHTNEKKLKYLLINIKKKLKAGGNTRFVNKNFQNLQSLQISNQKLLDETKGIEICLFFNQNKIVIAKTISVQDIPAYAKRDYEKPQRDAKSGMLPPKLAQIMLNLAAPFIKDRESTIYDPFCGTGTILGEALLMGYNVIGSDKHQKALEQANENLNWIKKEFPETQSSNILLFQHSVLQNFPAYLKEEKISAVVTESFLGPPLLKKPDPELKQKIARELSNLHLNFFKNIAEIIQPQTPIVITFPLWQNSRYTEETNITSQIEKLGFKQINPLPHQINKALIYQRPNQIVGREIQIWLKT